MKKKTYTSLTLQRNAYKDAEDALIIENFYEFCEDLLENRSKEKVETATRRNSCSHLRSSMLAMRNFLDGKVLCRLIENLGACKEDMVGFDETAKAESFKARQNVHLFQKFCDEKLKISMFGYNDIESCNLHAVATGLFKISVLILNRSEKDEIFSRASKFIPSSLKNIIAWRRVVRKKKPRRGVREKLKETECSSSIDDEEDISSKNLIITDDDSKRTYYVPAHTLVKKTHHDGKIDLSAISVLDSDTGEEMSLSDAARRKALIDRKKIHLARDGHTGRVFRVRIDVMNTSSSSKKEKSHARRKWVSHRNHLSNQALAIASATVKCVVCGQRLPLCRIDAHVATCFVPSDITKPTIEPSPALRAALERGEISVQEFKQIYQVEKKSRMMGDLTTVSMDDDDDGFDDDAADDDQMELCLIQ